MAECPPQIAKLVGEIIRDGVLRIRAEGWSGHADRCAIEADHIHNLPALLADYRPELLEYYWNVERPAYIDQSSGENIDDFKRIWKRLADFVPLATGALDVSRSAS